jgi:ArsR family transcriptional regulator
MTDEDTALGAVAKFLGHPARIRIVRRLQVTPGCIGGDTVEAAGPAQSTVSEHPRVLKAARVIMGEIDGPRVCYALHAAAFGPLAGLIAGLTPPPEGLWYVPVSQAPA